MLISPRIYSFHETYSVSSIFKINSNFELVVWSTHSLRPIANLSDEEVQEIVSVMFTVGDEYIITGSKVGEFLISCVSSKLYCSSTNLHYLH